MALIHCGTRITLASVLVASISNDDTAYIFYNARSHLMKFFISSTEATDMINRPLHLRPGDYATAGVWIEDLGDGSEPDAWNGAQIVTGKVISTNWSTSLGSELDLDAGTIRLGGSSSPKFSVSTDGILTCTGAVISGELVAITGTIGGFTISSSEGLYAGTGITRVQMKAGVGFWAGATAQTSAPFRVTEAGALTASFATITGTVTSSALTATGGTIGGWILGAASLVSTNIGLHSGASAEILLGHATTYASAKIGLKNDGSGKLANGNISWTAGGLVTTEIASGGNITLKSGADLILEGSDTDPGIILFDGTSYDVEFGADANGEFGINPLTTDVAILNIGNTNKKTAPTEALWDTINLVSSSDVIMSSHYDYGGANYASAGIHCHAGLTNTAVYFSFNDPGEISLELRFEKIGVKYCFRPSTSYDVDLGYDGVGTRWHDIHMEGDINLADNSWIGLGSSAGRIEFDNQTTDEINFLTCNVGIGTSTPAAKLSINGGLHVGGDSDPGDNNLLVDGNITATYFNTTPNNVTSGVTQVLVETGNDGYMRHGSAAAIRTFLNVESGATADQTAAQILTAIKTVDGSGSGLDADLLDNISSGSFLRSNANDNLTAAIIVPTANRDEGIFGTYDSTKTQHIWSMGTSYRNAADGSSFGNLYGLAYKYNGSAGSHGIYHVINGTATVGFGTNIWTSGDLYVDDFARIDALRVGTTSTDPGDGVLYVEDYGVFVGGVRIGSSSDPGANNLSVAGTLTVSGIATATELNITGGAWTNNKNEMYVTSTNGFIMHGYSSAGTNDVVILGNSGLQAIRIPRGTDDVVIAGDLSILGSLFKGSGTFRIDHPLDKSKLLYHSFIEGPKADLIYRGTINLINGNATVNIDSVSNMTEGTFVTLTQDRQVFLQNNDSWTSVKGSILNNILTIESQTPCSDNIGWLVIAERADDVVKAWDLTDEDGHLIPEWDKENKIECPEEEAFELVHVTTYETDTEVNEETATDDTKKVKKGFYKKNGIYYKDNKIGIEPEYTIVEGKVELGSKSVYKKIVSEVKRLKAEVSFDSKTGKFYRNN